MSPVQIIFMPVQSMKLEVPGQPAGAPKKPFRPDRRNKAGYSLMELLAVFIIILLMVGFILGMISYLTNLSKVNQTQESVTALAISLQGVYKGSNSYSGLNNALAIKTGAAPPNLTKGNVLATPWGGDITVAPGSDAATFSISLAGLNEKNCIAMATYQVEAWHNVAVNGSAISKNEAVASANNLCSGDSNTVMFVSR